MHTPTLSWTTVRAGVHLLMASLLLVLVVQALVAGDGSPGPFVLAAVVTAGVYVLGATGVVRGDRRRVLVWLVALTACWGWMLVLAPEAVYLAFPLYFLAGHLLSDRRAVLGVAALAALAVVGYAAHEGLSTGAVLGPVLGAFVALATVLGLRAVQRESTRRGVLEERERLAREVHDTLAQGLSSINLLLGAAAARLPRGADLEEPTALIGQARQVAVENLEEARRLVRALAPPALDGAALTDALRAAVDAAPGAVLRVRGPERALPAAVEVAVLRIGREALANAVRHAGADRIEVTLSHLDEVVRLDVVDDGHGFAPGAGGGTGYGLTSMRARAAEAGGHLAVESTPGEGTAVSLSVPLSGAEVGV